MHPEVCVKFLQIAYGTQGLIPWEIKTSTLVVTTLIKKAPFFTPIPYRLLDILSRYYINA